MQQHKSVEEYIEALLPSGISHGLREDIISEMSTHIEERIDYFLEEGLSEREAEERAIAEMGDGAEVKKEFKHVYRKSAIPSVLFPIVYAVLSALTFLTGFVYFTVDSGEDPTALTVIGSTLISLGIFYAMYRAYKHKNTGFLITAILTCFTGEVLWLFTAGMHQHFFCAVAELLNPIAFMLQNNETAADILSTVKESFIILCSLSVNFVYVALGIIWCRKCNVIKIYKNPPKRKCVTLSEGAVFKILVSVFILIVGNFIVYNGFFGGSGFMERTLRENADRKICEKFYNQIDYSMSYNEAEALLLDSGFEKSEEESYDAPDGIKTVAFSYRDNYNIIYISKTDGEPIIFKSAEYEQSDHIIGLGVSRKLKQSKFLESLDKLETGMSFKMMQNTLDTDNADLFFVFSEKKNGSIYDMYYYSWSAFSIEDEKNFEEDAFLTVMVYFKDGQLVGVMRDNGDTEEITLGEKEAIEEIYADSTEDIYY